MAAIATPLPRARDPRQRPVGECRQSDSSDLVVTGSVVRRARSDSGLPEWPY
jgi:hypothetical protein